MTRRNIFGRELNLLSTKDNPYMRTFRKRPEEVRLVREASRNAAVCSGRDELKQWIKTYDSKLMFSRDRYSLSLASYCAFTGLVWASGLNFHTVSVLALGSLTYHLGHKYCDRVEEGIRSRRDEALHQLHEFHPELVPEESRDASTGGTIL